MPRLRPRQTNPLGSAQGAGNKVVARKITECASRLITATVWRHDTLAGDTVAGKCAPQGHLRAFETTAVLSPSPPPPPKEQHRYQHQPEMVFPSTPQQEPRRRARLRANATSPFSFGLAGPSGGRNYIHLYHKLVVNLVLDIAKENKSRDNASTPRRLYFCLDSASKVLFIMPLVKLIPVLPLNSYL